MYYEFDQSAALTADNTHGRITEKGKYIGKFTRAEHITSKNTGTIGIDFDFVTDDGLRARLALYTRKADGTTIYGYRQLMAILACLRQRGVSEPQNVLAKVYDFDAQREVEKLIPQFPELLNKPIGLLIHMEQYGEEGKWRPGIAYAFEANTELMASEILKKKTVPEQLPKALLTLRDRPMKEANQNASIPNAYEAAKNGNLAYANQLARAGWLDDLDSDIPF